MGAHSGLLSDVPAPTTLRRVSVPILPAGIAALLFALLALLPALFVAISGWLTDPLRSIGVLFPLAAIVFLIRDLREFPGPWKITFSGLWLIGTACSLLVLQEFFAIHLTLTHKLQLTLPPGFAISLMVAGALVLFGGWKLLRACLFPVVLVGITNPIPHVFNTYFDLPLQMASASAARGFAHVIHESPTGEQLRLMFTPEFGMFIAPGCNGIRGAIALGLLALFAAAWKKLRPWQAALYLLAGLAIGYLFNFLRLFVLVLYYKLGQSWQAIAPWGTQVDYAIGGTLFLLASFALGSMVFQSEPLTVSSSHRSFAADYPMRNLWKALGLFCLLCVIPAALNLRVIWHEAHRMRDAVIATDQLPAQSGRYHRALEWNEFVDGMRVYHWGRYTNGTPADDVDLGVWLPASEHDIRYCRAFQGEVLESLAPIQHASPGTDTMTYSTYRYTEANGTPVLLASLSCPGCTSRIVGVDHHVGPMHVTSATPTNYFAAYPARSILLVHKGSPGIPTNTLLVPLQHFLDGLEERTLFQTKSHSQQ